MRPVIRLTKSSKFLSKRSISPSEGNCAKKLIKVTADDGTGNCPAVSKTRLYTKITTITTSDPP